jgi:ABC-type multidrug transport system fused ATPase/permease subunit
LLQVCGLYGQYYRKLSTDIQTCLASANVVADESLGSITTVRSHAAEQSIKEAYSAELLKYYFLTCKASLAYGLYVIISTFSPQVRIILSCSFLIQARVTKDERGLCSCSPVSHLVFFLSCMGSPNRSLTSQV